MSDAIPYIEHYFTFPDILIFFLVSFAALAVILFFFMIFARISTKAKRREEPRTAENRAVPACSGSVEDDAVPACFGSDKDNPARLKFLSLTQRFYELLYSGTSILFFITVYYLIDRFYDYYPVKSFLVKYQSFLLLFLIVLSCLLNSFLDRVFTRLSSLSKDDRSSIRILGMFYMLLIFGYVKFIYENNNYDYFITYFLGLMIGRFVYFDASFKDFAGAIGNAFKNIPLMLFGLAATGFLAWIGFVKSDYLVKHIGVITNVFICHLFMCFGVLILFYIHPEDWLFKKK